MIYTFVLDDSLTSLRFTTRTEQLNKCCKPLQKMRVRLGPCDTQNVLENLTTRLIYMDGLIRTTFPVHDQTFRTVNQLSEMISQ